MPALCAWALAMAGWGGRGGPVTNFLLFTAATLIVSSASWFLLEKPLNELGRK